MGAHRNIHLAEEIDHLIDGYSEFASHVVHEKLTQNTTSLIPYDSRGAPPHELVHPHELLLRQGRKMHP